MSAQKFDVPAPQTGGSSEREENLDTVFRLTMLASAWPSSLSYKAERWARAIRALHVGQHGVVLLGFPCGGPSARQATFRLRCFVLAQ